MPKMTLINETCRHQPDARAVTVEKKAYLEKTGLQCS